MQSRQAIAHERSRQKRQQKQEEVAAQHNRQRLRRKIEEMMMAYQKAHLDAEKTYKKMEHLERKQAEQMRNLDQLRFAVEGGECEVSVEGERQLRRVAGFGKKEHRITEAEYAVIESLLGTMT
ncbi:hypothetical protein JG687_00013839 [Phytophthora cactorum]|uniref:Uncharacterized protein n=1 Tax=Phytophthora cactorum TaxID=29920 RepID=A0A329S4R2_9STRA|nr:hypothetical protein Pcac1_g1372 [Phytophthora cactorum]KAG2837186.1 hypothetical protein PC111_g4734 [Phytophthora cactorum]KAG2837935.1 hypothetical protein PC112_g4707 [Phytophthora cactorum]KAG2862803.1 hypothetical protein PC113_g5985 [Phytophthora cactorum]KAG2923305.1 hypothetical protein PC114_g4867 [Phytophthora cactorum]